MNFLRLSLISTLLLWGQLAHGQERLPVVAAGDISLQPFRKLSVERVIDGLRTFGSPMAAKDVEALELAIAAGDDGIPNAQRILDSYALCAVIINPESRVKVRPGPALRDCRLVKDGARNFLVKVINEGGVTAPLRVSSDEDCVEPEIRYERPMGEGLSGLELEYCIVSLVSRGEGTCAADLQFDVGPWSRDLGSRSSMSGIFRTGLNQQIQLDVKDSHGNATTGSFVIKDAMGAIHPSPVSRQEPDFSFHDQVYRSDGESIALPHGDYTITFRRGPESIPEERAVTVDGNSNLWTFQETRWVDTAALGYASIDHHLHPAGCGHYMDPNCGVTPLSMARHCEGEDVNAESLIWGPCYDFQKDFLTGDPYPLGTPPTPKGYLGYGLETSGLVPGGVPIGRVFGHIFFLGLESTFASIDDFPKRALPILRWGEAQGAVIGYSHVGAGMHVSTQVPSYLVPPVNSVGAVSAPVYVTEPPLVSSRTLRVMAPDAVAGRVTSKNSIIDLLGVCNTSYTAELNLWYHLLSCGFQISIAGESDFPCIYDDRVGRGRSYVKTSGRPDTYRAFLNALADGRSYVSTGESHLIDFRLTTDSGGSLGPEVRVGEDESTATMSAPGTLDVRVEVSALLDRVPKPGAPSMTSAINLAPYWALDRARVPGTRKVDVVLVINGFPAATKRIEADGLSNAVHFEDVPIDCSSWVAVRILGASHTNAIYVEVAGEPIRTSKKSAQWCMDVIDRYLINKMPLLDPFPGQQAQVQAIAARAKRTFARIHTEAKDDL